MPPTSKRKQKSSKGPPSPSSYNTNLPASPIICSSLPSSTRKRGSLTFFQANPLICALDPTSFSSTARTSPCHLSPFFLRPRTYLSLCSFLEQLKQLSHDFSTIYNRMPSSIFISGLDLSPQLQISASL